MFMHGKVLGFDFGNKYENYKNNEDGSFDLNEVISSINPVDDHKQKLQQSALKTHIINVEVLHLN